ncbi:rod shape-determining protein MreC [Clostridium baratii]|uniref:rod shape-determining protein MreC n=1 Tax=Clostridium baratii TaxID=1561 RepID=UPI0009A2FEB8|nr:rod shape-determining protein MreC [Clostridium baratii]OPF52767.1 rod shape-determining protein MreC [Clostridium baratii]OPF56216.1 rod shape-determining protein MreC [Clostridium baratii]OPF58189.1 rod shape-determining protein MreC [Clostridium baratii]OPF59402.1 rod shape-determining protein MreC [Clostridium baratii]
MKRLKNKLAVTIIVLSVAFLGLIVFTFKSPDKNMVESGAGIALNPLQRIAYTVNTKLKSFVDLCLNFSTVKEENKSLTEENAKLKKELLEYSGLKAQNDELRKVLDFEDSRKNYNYIATNIIGYSGGNILDGYIVDKGSNSGIQKGMIVIASNGLVGQVTNVGTNWSIIQSILNENIAVSVKVESTKENTGILRGYRDSNGTSVCKVENLPMDSQIKEGDTIVTSGLGQIYPKDIMVGKVKSVTEDKVKVMKSAVVEPAVDFNKLESLFIVVPKDTRDIKYN